MDPGRKNASGCGRRSRYAMSEVTYRLSAPPQAVNPDCGILSQRLLFVDIIGAFTRMAF